MTDQLFGSELQVLSFAGLSLTGTSAGGDYQGVFLVQFDIAAQYRPDVVESESEGVFPTFVRTDPNSKVLPLGIRLTAQENDQNMLDALKSAFSASRDIDYLRVKDANGNTRRMRAKSLGLAPYLGDDQYNYVASLEAPEPVWENDTPSVIFYNVSGTLALTTKSWFVTNGGNEECYPAITITPYEDRPTGAFDYMLPITIAWRSSLEGVDSQGLPYPINLTDGLWNTVGLLDYTSAGVRAWLDGVEIDRYVTNSDTTSTSVWASVPFQPARTATLSANITGTTASMTVTNPDDLAAFPDVGFLLVDSECIAYRGKTATTFAALKRGQRGTGAAAHTAGATIYWVEHDIRLSWGAFSQGVAPGISSADAKPIIDLAASTNRHHKYGITDGLIQPESLRTGQWVRELRAPAGGKRAEFASLGQTAGVVAFTDREPIAGAPNFDSLSLYTPCFVSSNVTGVALDMAVDHLMALNLYGVDTEGFESLMHRRDCLGWLPNWGKSDGVVRMDYMVDVPTFATRSFAPSGDLTRLTVEAYTGALVGIWDANANVNADIGEGASASGSYSAQILNVESDRDIRTALFNLWIVNFPSNSYGSWDGAINATSYIPDSTTPFLSLVNTVTIPRAALPAVKTLSDPPPYFAPITVEFGSDGGAIAGGSGEIMRWRGKIALALNKIISGTTGRYLVEISTVPRYANGTYWTGKAAVDTEQLYKDMFVMVADGVGEPQADATLGTGFDVQVKNVDVHFNPAFTPLIVRGAQANAYTLHEVLLTNNTTGESIRISGLLPIDAVQTDDIFKIDASGHVCTLLTDLPTDYEQPAGYAIDPSDIQKWLTLLPGVNSITMSNTGSGPRTVVRFFYRSRWT